jgi:hypothetical protein
MKAVISFHVVLVFLQSIIFGSLVSIEVPAKNAFAVQETFIHNNASLDEFLIPENTGLNQNLLNRNQFLPFLYINQYSKPGITNPLVVFNDPDQPSIQHKSSTPLIIHLGILRI